jgi:hypothetical protein
MKYILLVFFLASVFNLSLFATELTVSDPLFYYENDKAYVIATVQWNNAWRNKRNYDAAWIFAKFLRGNNGYVHADILNSDYKIIDSNAKLTIEVPSDGSGLFVYPSAEFRGNVIATIKFSLNLEIFKNFNPYSGELKVFGIEMVFIPEGPVVLGDEHESQLRSFWSISVSLLGCVALRQALNRSRDCRGGLGLAAGEGSYTVPVLVGLWPWMAEGRPAGSQKMQEQFSGHKGNGVALTSRR